MFVLEIRESKNKNTKNTKNGRNIKIPIIDTIGSGNGIIAVPINNQITIVKSRQFLLNFFRLSNISIKRYSKSMYLNFLIQKIDLNIVILCITEFEY